MIWDLKALARATIAMIGVVLAVAALVIVAGALGELLEDAEPHAVTIDAMFVIVTDADAYPVDTYEHTPYGMVMFRSKTDRMLRSVPRERISEILVVKDLKQERGRTDEFR